MKKLPICVDLDGTLIHNEISVESALNFIKNNWLRVFKLLYWLCYGRAYTKYQVGCYQKIQPEKLNYNDKFLSFLKEKNREGYLLFLATGATICYAEQIANYLGIFSGVFASNENQNLTGINKARKLEETFGSKGFIYAGNSMDDIYIWDKAAECIVVCPDKNVLRTLQKTEYKLFE